MIHQSGSVGSVVFLFKNKKETANQVDVLLPNGITIPVAMGDDLVAWIAVDADLAGVAKLNYTNLRPWAMLEKQALILFGPAGTQGVVCINNAPLTLKVPTGKAPLVERHEDLVVIVLNTQQVDAGVSKRVNPRRRRSRAR